MPRRCEHLVHDGEGGPEPGTRRHSPRLGLCRRSGDCSCVLGSRPLERRSRHAHPRPATSLLPSGCRHGADLKCTVAWKNVAVTSVWAGRN